MTPIPISDTLHRRLSLLANRRGESVNALVEHAIEEYLADLEENERSPDKYQATEANLVTLLEAARAEYEASGEPWLDWEGIEKEVAERRGGYQWENE